MNITFKKAWTILFSVFLVGYSAYILLDAFVIPSDVVAMSDVIEETDVSSTESEAVYHEPEITDTSYDDGLVQIQIDTFRVLDTTIYSVDVQLSSPSYLRAGLAGGSFGRNLTETTSVMARENDAILAISGDYYGFRTEGYVMRNGYLYRSVSAGDDQEDLVIYEDGSFAIIREGDISASELEKQGATNIFSFGPGLLVDGEITVDANSEVEHAQVKNPRAAIGIVGDLHYKFVVSDGRTTESSGLSLLELAEVMQDLGCIEAYNLDGGGSATLWFNGEVINKPTTFGKVIEERSISDIIYIRD